MTDTGAAPTAAAPATPEASTEVADLIAAAEARADRVMDRITEAMGGHRRDGQYQMARAVAASLTSGQVLCAEGGTGTGKSLAYLAGGIAADLPGSLLIAPHTKQQQQQLWGDLLLLQGLVEELVAEGESIRPLTIARLFGISNYVCPAKLVAGEEPGQAELSMVGGGPSSPIGEEVARIAEWVQSDPTATGLRMDAPSPVSSRAWAAVSVTSDNCAGKACPLLGDCFAVKARQEAAEARVVVTNQKWLAIGMKIPVLPGSVVGVVIDEAHEFPNVVAETFGATITPARLNALIKRCETLDTHTTKAGAARERATAAVTALDGACRPLPKEPDPTLAQSPHVVEALTAVKEAFAALGSLIRQVMPQNDEEEVVRKQLLMRQFNSVGEDLQTIMEGTGDEQVVWTESKNDGPALRAVRYDVAPLMREHLFDAYNGAVVATSATLRVGASFYVPAVGWGLWDPARGEETRPWRSIVVPSPFDYPRQGALWLPGGMPDPTWKQPAPPTRRGGRAVGPPIDPEAHLKAVAAVAEKVIRAANGGVLILCTSWRSVGTISQYLQRSLGEEWPLLVQQPGEPAGPLAAQFAADPRASLIGTRTFWTGVSRPGCSAVIVDKIPFPSPGDPLVAARKGKADRRQPDAGFREVFLADAATSLQQGVGRLIRTVKCGGVVVICDPRLDPNSPHYKQYGRMLLGGLPPFRKVGEAEAFEVLRARAEAATITEAVDVQIDEPSDDDS